METKQGESALDGPERMMYIRRMRKHAVTARLDPARLIHIVRGHRVVLDTDLAALYGVSTKRLNEQVKRNSQRFPDDFAFYLTAEEGETLKSQNATANKRRGGRRTLPWAFTEHGALMAASVLNSDIAVAASVEVVRAFVRMREVLISQAELARKVAALERKYDGQFKLVFQAIRELMTPPPPVPKRRIGY